VKTVHVETGRHFYGGAQQVIWLLEGLRTAGLECQLVCPPDSDIETAAVSAGLDVRPIPCAGDHDVRFAWRFRRFLRRARPDLVHCHSRRGADFLGGWAANSAGVSAILSRRVDNPESARMAALRYRPFRRIVAISDNIAAVLKSNGLDPARLEVIRDAVDVECVNTEPAADVLQNLFGINENQFSIAVVAQLIKRKGHRFLFDVLPGLCLKHPHIKVVIFGVGPQEEHLRALVRKLGLSGAVIFAGFRLDLDEYLAAFDLLVHPAEKEGLGVAMLKGAAAGLPVIAFDVGGAKEAVGHGTTGALIPAGDLGRLQKAIELMIDEPEMRRSLGAAGRQRMQEEFSVRTMVESHIELYERVMNE
jgi:glycosyltransferase involved in cell wall biosynthesis